jgi:hypothetical protein
LHNRGMTAEQVAGFQTCTRLQRVSKENLESLERLSPVASITSLDRYIARPMSDEAASARAIANSVNMVFPRPTLDEDTDEDSVSIQARPIRRRVSRPGSIQSFGSAGSWHSFGSVHSADFRGKRRGRKQWRRLNGIRQLSADTSGHAPETWQDGVYQRSQNQLPIDHSSTSISDCEDSTANSCIFRDHSSDSKEYITNCQSDPLRIFCTWLGCDARFKHRYEWIRHEGSLHYQPYRWLCCAETAAPIALPECYICGEKSITTLHVARQHFSSCMAKQESERDFWRKDHLSDHIKRMHYKKPVPEDLLTAWKSDNLDMPREHLQCGFCGHISSDWEERTHHVFQHIMKGKRKSAWKSFAPTHAVSVIDFASHDIFVSASH